MRKLQIVVALLGLSLTTFAQNCNLSNNIIVTNTVCEPIQTGLSAGNYTLKARDGIIFQPGFQLAASQGHTFTATLDNALANQVNSYESSTVNTNPIPALDKSNCIPGTIGGTVDVSPSGSAIYQIPIQVSPGTGGMQPNLSITYNSQGGNGLLGWGWNIGGLSSISRVGKNAYYDGNFEAVSLTGNDFALDGQRLIPSSTQGTYYPANNPYTSVVFVNNSYFTVTTQNGVIMEYGKEGNSLVKAAQESLPISYSISSITDPNGNYMKFIYAEDNSIGEHRISEIKYTGNTSGQSPYNSVKFYYDKRNDSNSRYFAGGKLTQSLLLSSIKVFCEGKLSKDYEFSYFNDLYSKLYQISLTADGAKYNPTTIRWGENDYSSTVANDSLLGSFNNFQLYPGDFNGDGIIDIAKLDKHLNTLSVSFALGNGNYSSSTISLLRSYNTGSATITVSKIDSFDDIKIADVDNDGTDDILAHFTFTNSVTTKNTNMLVSIRYSSTAGGFYFQHEYSNVIPHYNPYKFFFGDFNNDGVTERLTISFRNITGCGSLTVPSGTGVISNVDDVQLIDFDGDGRRDILTISEEGFGSIWEYNGTTFVNIYGDSDTTFFGKPKNLFFGDFNADGKTDYLSYNSSKWNLFYSTGIGFVEGSAPELLNFEPASTGTINYGNTFKLANTIYVDDINNDGKSDICQAVDGEIGEAPEPNIPGSIDIFVSKGNSFVKISSTSLNTNNSASISLQSIDLNNDGQKELIFGNYSYDSEGIPTSPYFQKVEFSGGILSKNLFVKAIYDGFNNKSTITYSTYTDPSSAITQFPLMRVRGPWQLVSNLSVANGSDLLSDVTYSYSDGYSHLGGLGFLGFKTFTSDNSVNNVSTTSNFEYTISGAVGIYSPWLESQSVNMGGTISTVTNTMEAKSLNTTNKSFIPIVTSSTSVDGFTGVTTQTSTVFNETYGRVTSTTLEKKDESIVTSTEWYQVSGYIYRPTSTTTKHKDYSNTVEFKYSTLVPLRVNEQKEKGVTTAYNSFDAYGNPLSITVSGGDEARTTSYTYEPKGRFIETATDVLGNKTTYSYRASDGAILTEVSPLGTTTYTYAAQGGKRVTTAKLPDGRVSKSEMGWDEVKGYYSKASVDYGNTVTTKFNSLGQKEEQTVLGFKGKPLTSYYTYYSDGKLKTEKLPGIETLTTYSYKPDGRISSITGHNGLSVSYTYSDLSVITVNNLTGTETKDYSPLGYVNKITSTNGGIIEYKYTDFGKVSEIIAEGDTTSMTYYDNTLNQKTLTDPNTGTTTYDYNGLGQLVTQKDAKEQTITCSYDGAGRLIGKTDGNKLNESYEYYGQNEQLGLLKKVTRNGVSETYTYDGMGRILSVLTEGAGKPPYTTSYEYNAQQRLDKIKHPTGLTVQYDYDAVGNLTKISSLAQNGVAAGTIWEGKDQNERQQWTNFEMSNGLIKTVWGYDGSKYSLNSIKAGTGSNPTSIHNLGFNFNTKGQLEQRTEGTALTEDFDYDALNRLTTATITKIIGGNTTVSQFTSQYQPNGNISSTSLTGNYSYSTGHPHAVDSLSLPTGNYTKSLELSTSSSFTPDNCIDTMSNAISRNVFAYGPSGNRFKVEHSTVTNGTYNVSYSKVYVGSSEFLYGSNGTQVLCKRTFIYAPTGICAVYQDSATVKSFHYIHTDNLGSWLKITDANGNVKNRYSYDAWGRPRNPNTWDLLPINTANALVNLNAMQPRFDRGYTGHEHMAGFGLINMNGRLFDPYLQRFLSPDNVVQSPDNAQNYNRYSYCLNNPLMYTDPSGWQFAPLDPPMIDYNSGWLKYAPYGANSCVGYRSFDENNGYYYSSGGYYNWKGESVSWDEVNNNFVRPNAMNYSGAEAQAIYSLITDPRTVGFSIDNNNGLHVYQKTLKIPYTWLAGIGLGFGVGIPSGQGGDPYAKYGNVIGGVNLSGTLALGGGGAFEFGYVVTDKGYRQNYFTLYTSAAISASFNYAMFFVRPTGSKGVTIGDWKGPYSETGASAGFFGVQWGGSESGYTTYTISVGPSVNFPSKASGGAFTGNTFLIGDPMPFANPGSLDPAGSIWFSIINW